MSKKIVAAGLMTADAVYATYTAVGNTGLLDGAGVDKIAEGYKKQLQDLQNIRKEKNSQREEQKIKATVEQIVSFPDDE